MVNGTPSSLTKGSKVGIVATARFMDKADIEKAASIMREAGFDVLLANNLDLIDNQYSGSDIERANALQIFLDDPEIEAIFCARGGYGTVRIMDKLDFTKFEKNPKWVIGFSDVTVLHSYIVEKLKGKCIHGTMPITLINNDHPDTQESNKKTFDLIKSNKTAYSFTPTTLHNPKNVKAEIVGGNLSILYSLLASDADINTNGKILYIEDLDEYLYHIDRMMMAMKRSGKLDNLKGLFVGSLSDMNDNQIPFGKSAQQIIEEHTIEYGYPVVFGFPAGHQKKNYPIILGHEAEVVFKGEEVNFSQSL